MSTRKRPLSEPPQPHHPQVTRKPTRYAPSTPHAIRALQQRSGATNNAATARKTRTVRTIRTKGLTNDDESVLRPDSARGILRRFAKITAKESRKAARTPVGLVGVGLGKENVLPAKAIVADEEGIEEDRLPKRPRLTLDLDEDTNQNETGSEGDVREAPEYEEEDDSELPAAPTPSVLPDDGDGDNPTLTFQSIDFAKKALPTSEKTDRRKSRLSLARTNDGQGNDGDEDDDEDDYTILTERGRRAISEDMTGRLSRYSFGSLRMSEFGTELEVRRESGMNKSGKRMEPDDGEDIIFTDEGYVLDGETEDLGRLRRSLSVATDESSVNLPTIDDTFRLELPREEEQFRTADERATKASKEAAITMVDNEVEADVSGDLDEERDAGHGNSDDEQGAEQTVASPAQTRQLTEMETISQVATASKSRRRKMKVTRHGTMVPSLPSSLIRRIATETQVQRGSRKPKLGREHMKALEQATEWFFEQVSEDLAAYSSHGRRKKRIDVSDALMLIRRQRVIEDDEELQQLAKDWLPAEVVAELDLPGRLGNPSPIRAVPDSPSDV